MTVFDPRSLRVYVVTSGSFGRGHLDVAMAAIEGGATAVQLRATEMEPARMERLAAEIARACRSAGVLFLVNDSLGVAQALDDVGVHVGQDQDPARVRSRLGLGRVLGVSVADPAQGRAAAAAGADYVGVTVWSTSTKPDAVGGGPELVRSIAETSGLPVVGIGGIGPGNAAQVMEAGAAGVAVISAVAAAKDPVAATRTLRGLVDAHGTRDRGGAS